MDSKEIQKILVISALLFVFNLTVLNFLLDNEQ